MLPIKRGDVVKVVRGEFDVWIPRTPEELQALRDRDIAAGRFHDDGGEPIMYGCYGGFPLKPDAKLGFEQVDSLDVTVTLTRKVEWKHWGHKPKFLYEGTATIDGVVRVVKFKKRNV
jgi:hypothetical protein